MKESSHSSAFVLGQNDQIYHGPAACVGRAVKSVVSQETYRMFFQDTGMSNKPLSLGMEEAQTLTSILNFTCDFGHLAII